jgi:ABC-type transport system involved in multi-copper enzyme maturation permease subunit
MEPSMTADAKPLPAPISADRPRGSRWDYALFAALSVLPVVAAVADLPLALIIAASAPALIALQWLVWRRGGWRLIGPHSYYDLIRISRKGRTTLLRTLFLVALFGAVAYTFEKHRPASLNVDVHRIARLRDQLARLNMRCVHAWFLLQNITIVILTPAYLGGAIAEEREGGTLDLLLATGLYGREIVLGKLLARLVHLGGFLIAGLPVFSIMLVLGGIDVWVLLTGWVNSAALLLTTASFCIMFSTMPVRASTAIMFSYGVVLPIGGCCVGFWETELHGATFLNWTEPLIFLGIGYGFTIAFCVSVAITAVRLPEMPHEAGASRWNQPEPVLPAVIGAFAQTPPAVAELVNEAVHRSRLPPVADDALLWKERYTGGRSLLVIPEFLVLLVMPAAMLIPLLLASGSAIIADSDRTLVGVLHGFADGWGDGLRGAYAFFLICYGIGVAFRTAGSVVRERQMHTLDMLLQLPGERHEILSAKWLGALFKGRPWLMLAVGDLWFGLVIGVYHPVTFLFLLLGAVPWILALCSVGLLISTIVRTTAQANLAMGCTLLALAVYAGTIGSPPRSLVCTWWDSPSLAWGDYMSLAVSTVAALLVACWASALASTVFARK